jgi:type II restriction/modification system DNA methylase subunit YeeA
METTQLKKFAQLARRRLIEQVSAKLKAVLNESSLARREQAEAVKKLEDTILKETEAQVVERVAYIWFNRFCALRFMDVNRYTRMGLVSPAEGQLQPEILAEAKMGHIDEEMVPEKTRQQIFALLEGKSPSRDPQGEAYRLLLVAVCNYWHNDMPFLFERIDDYTEMLMPDDLLSDKAVPTCIREAMTPDACKNVEVIGWLYQFYISEKKDDVFAGLKKGKKVTPENIPAATQLFTPHWIVRYLVENSLGRLWLLNRPKSQLVEKMAYYIKPEQTETDFLHIGKPEELKICDPACGSGHMLTYAFDLLYAIYEEEGYAPAEIPEKILTHNLYGIEIDERAGELAAFALTMKARAKHRRFFSKQIKPNICVLEAISFEDDELKRYMNFVGRDLFTAPLLETLHQFEEADNFGSLIRPTVKDVAGMREILRQKGTDQQLLLLDVNRKVTKALEQADYLSPKYHVVLANPPYMGGKGMSPRLASWLKDNYADVKSDLFSAFIVRNTELALPKGQLGFMTPFVWMFISSYEKLRSFLIEGKTITSLVQLEYSGFDGATVPICTFTLENNHKPDFKGGYVKLSDFRGSENQAPKTLEAIKNPNCGWFYRASAADFRKIPGSPIAYWVSGAMRNIFSSSSSFNNHCYASNGVQTGNNELFVRNWNEVSFSNENSKWIPYNKGGEYRKWYGNNYYYVNWENDGQKIKSQKNSCIRGEDNYFNPGITWSDITSAKSSFKYFSEGHLFDAKGPSAFFKEESIYFSLGYLNTKLVEIFSKILNPTLSFQIGDFRNLPFKENMLHKVQLTELTVKAVQLSKTDWDAYETSWDFTRLPLLQPEYRQPTLQATYQALRTHWREMTLEMQRLEEENNRIFIDAYGLQEELTPHVPLNEITLTCNPHYRYDHKKTDDELEALLLADTMRELLSYAVGCMFGRYSLDKPGLILANQGETVEDYLKQVPNPSFTPDADNVIPILDGDWFADEITERFLAFLKITFGETHLQNNVDFIEQALGKNGKPQKLRDYFVKDFYSDHVKRYKKRPIYWLFSSPKGSFNALIYMHRYRSDTASIVLNDYLREFRTKLAAQKSHLQAVSINASALQADKTKALKEIEKIAKTIKELEDYERDVMYPLATQQVEIDLDDGVKVNYPKLGAGLKKILGLDEGGD